MPSIIENASDPSVDPAFDRYIFVEKMRGKAAELLQIKSDYPNLESRIEIIKGDANEQIERFCARTDWRMNRAVVFLDPFGSQVEFATLKTIARCNIDLWYLFPSYLSVSRQINNDGRVDESRIASLNRVLGTSDWPERLLRKEKGRDLFGETETTAKEAGADTVTRYMIERMKVPFEGRVLDEWLPLGRHESHWYSLLFAWGNPSPAAGKAARRIAKHLMIRQ